MEQGYRSEVQERALVVSLQMFNLILERGVALLKEQLDKQDQPRLVVNELMQVLLPAIKVRVFTNFGSYFGNLGRWRPPTWFIEVLVKFNLEMSTMKTYFAACRIPGYFIG